MRSGKLVRIGNGRGVIIPREVCDRLGLRPGAPLRIETDGDRIVIVPEPEGPRRAPPPRRLSDRARRALREILWDVPMSPEEFLDIVEGRREHPRRAYWVARMLELMDWFDVLDACDVAALADVWPAARRYVRSESLREGLDHAFSRYSAEHRKRLRAAGSGPGNLP